MENEISMLRDALDYEIRLIVNADNIVELTFDACLAVKNLNRLIRLKQDQVDWRNKK